MNSERYRNKMDELHTKMGTLKINIDRMIIGSLSCTAASQYMDLDIVSDALIASSIALALGATVNGYKLYRYDKKCEIVQRIYYSQEKQKTYKIDNK